MDKSAVTTSSTVPRAFSAPPGQVLHLADRRAPLVGGSHLRLRIGVDHDPERSVGHRCSPRGTASRSFVRSIGSWISTTARTCSSCSIVSVTFLVTVLPGTDRYAEIVCELVVPSPWDTVTVLLTVLPVPGRHSLTVSVRRSVLSGWWVSLTMSGMGTRSAASRSAPISTERTISPRATGRLSSSRPLQTAR